MSGPVHPFLRVPPGAESRHRLKRAVARLTSMAGRDDRGPTCRILTYHRVNDDHPGDRLSVRTREFRSQMELLAGGGRPVIGLDEAVAGLAGRRPLPEGAVVLTFDDGYADNLACAAPILSDLGLQATFYLATGFIGTGTTFPRYQGCCAQDRCLSWPEVRELGSLGHTIGSHTRSHPELARLGREEARRELAWGREDIVTEFGSAPRHFCYPRGSESPEVRALVAEAGFESATTVRPGSNAPGIDLCGLNRTEVSGDDSIADFAAKIAGRYDVYHRLLQALRR